MPRKGNVKTPKREDFLFFSHVKEGGIHYVVCQEILFPHPNWRGPWDIRRSLFQDQQPGLNAVILEDLSDILIFVLWSTTSFRVKVMDFFFPLSKIKGGNVKNGVIKQKATGATGKMRCRQEPAPLTKWLERERPHVCAEVAETSRERAIQASPKTPLIKETR